MHNDQWSKRFSDFFDSRLPKNLWREFLGQKSKYVVITQQHCFDMIGLKTKQNGKIKKNSTFSSWRVANMELKQPRGRRQQKSHKFAYLTMKNSIFARFARAYFIFFTFGRRSRSFYDVKWPVLQLCGRREHMMSIWAYDDDVSIWWSTRLIKPNFCFDLSHRRSTTVSLETKNSYDDKSSILSSYVPSAGSNLIPG